MSWSSAVLAMVAGFWLPVLSHDARADKLQLTQLRLDGQSSIRAYLTNLSDDGSVQTSRTAANFQLMADAVVQGVSTGALPFEKVKEPLSLVIITQVSGPAIGPVLTEAKAGIRKLSQTLAALPGSDLSLLTYAGDTQRLLEAGSPAAAESLLAKLTPDTTGKEPHLLDALRTGIELLKSRPASRRKLIVVMTDGSDVSTEGADYRKLGRLSSDSGVVIDSIVYNAADPSRVERMHELSKRCHGLDRIAKSLTDISAQYKAVVDELNKQYVISFQLSLPGDDKEHLFQIVDNSGARPVYSNSLAATLPSAAATKVVKP